ncbi:glutamine-hydrolyzing carbamoyl-phosphate synthase small subunit [Candidatus Contubernalis alkaliaceticus]|uniref:glutamine-hydrolyzing carbamoyl-phosphate synthase small subunit n=1 Tax=Candidatus Contubernalis alkaliaceticus TaxID=338645 RepID=UPI001F4C3891|nr:glutamine-hydrolyzing carbamoyl-phosphate synthase small subunit [Candidatus Contubernalis alkalaceticus]UNC93360.1 glutamine-hydrolyzing carbamoyl-phosphate synthase small subunit [Candidatus Contubernalis alkalaceticus]
MKTVLMLADGTCFNGKAYGSPVKAVGEVVFNTSMGMYGEIITDPVSCGQIVVMTYPLIGNYGIHSAELYSQYVHASGMVLREGAAEPSSWRMESTLEKFLQDHGVPGVVEVDTRALTRHLRRHGSMPGLIASQDEVDPAFFKNYGFEPVRFIEKVTTEKAYNLVEGESPVVVVDLGMGSWLPTALQSLGLALRVVPAGTPAAEILAMNPRGLVISSGPEGDPELTEIARQLYPAVISLPTMGVGLGMEVIALSLGARLEKMKFGHRGTNQPVTNLAGGKNFITCQNHGFVVEESSLKGTGLKVTERNIHDGTLEGLAHEELPVIAVQYYPSVESLLEGEETLFARFKKMIKI